MRKVVVLQLSGHHDGDFLQAFHGAGKTRSIVDRVIAASPSRFGLAIISFTNSAVNAFRIKCREEKIDPALGHPRFVGTFDGFIRLCLVLPQGIHNGRKSCALDYYR